MKILKKFVAGFLSLSLIFCHPIISFSENEPALSAPSAILVEPQTGKILYEKNSHQKMPCASITKVMTLILVMEAIESGKMSLTDVLSASDHAASMGGSDIWLKPGELMSVEDLIKATVIASANDAAVVLAEAVAGSEEAFVTKMNEKAKDLSMNDTSFKNCNGLDEDGHLTSAYDVSLMSKELIKHKEIFNYTTIWIDYIRDGKTQLVNTNKLLKSYKGITGLKTGTTDKAGKCISATAKRNNMSLIAVILGADTTENRFKNAEILLDYGFANFGVSTPKLSPDVLEPVPVLNGMIDQVTLEVDISKDILIQKGKEKNITCSSEIVESVTAPVEKGQVLGTLTYFLEGEAIAQYDITSQNSVEAITLDRAFKQITTALFKL